MKIPRQYSLVKFTCEKDHWHFYPFTSNGVYIFLGEIPNMPGHCVVVEHKSGRIYSGYHTDRFKEIDEDEI